jgi:feruloyl esterase
MLASALLAVAATTCESLSSLKLPDVRITEAATVAARPTAKIGARVAHCRVAGIIGREIRFQILLPVEWNRRFLMGGGGGFVGSVAVPTEEVNAGYATAGTDTGHQGSPLQAGWALGHLERQVNYGHAAVHRTAEVAKAVIRAHYDADAERSYFSGCSNGGRQALMEAQRYPEDFDGIVAGAPAFDFTNIAAAFIRNIKAAFPNQSQLSPLVTPDLLKLVERKILEACDGRDGVTDGVMEDPRDCRFDLTTISACPAGKPGPTCLTRAQRTVIQAIYSPTQDRAGRIYPGQPFGGEGLNGGWMDWITGGGALARSVGGGSTVPSAQWAFGTEFFKNFVFQDSTWDYTKYDLANVRRDTRVARTVLNADDPDLTPFTRRGGKLIIWHGWSDAALNAVSTIEFAERIGAKTANASNHVRLFLMPGVLHCAGGTGPDRVDWVKAVSTWVEKGEAPERLTASLLDDEGKPRRTRPLCAYPARAVYQGKGSSDEEASFDCRGDR